MCSLLRLTYLQNLLGASLVLSACTSLDQERTVTIRGKIRTTIENTWNPNSRAIASKIYTGAWEFHSLAKGQGVVVRLYRHDFLIGTYDGAGYYRIDFQLPMAVREGEEYSLRPVPPARPTRKEGEYDRVADMLPGELTAFRYGNPVMGRMESVDIASVKIISIRRREVIIHLKLKVDLDPHCEFDMDERFRLKVKEMEPEITSP